MFKLDPGADPKAGWMVSQSLFAQREKMVMRGGQGVNREVEDEPTGAR